MHADCDFPSNHKPSNAIIHRGKEKPHGFQIDPNFVPNQSLQSADVNNKKNERTLDSFQNGANFNSIVQSSSSLSKPNHSNQLNQSERFFSPGHTFKPPKESGFKDEYAGPAMQLVSVYIHNCRCNLSVYIAAAIKYTVCV